MDNDNSKSNDNKSKDGSESDSNNPVFWKVVTGVTPQTLLEESRKHREPVKVIAFYRDRKGCPWREFSNWYQGKHHGFDFVLPLALLEMAGVDRQQQMTQLFQPVVYCEQSEKAIMLCKAACMGDARSYALITASTQPREAKILGRQVAPWDECLWKTVVCGVALAVLRQKFAVPALREVLLSTGDNVLCEATAGDQIWAIGISIKMPKVYEVPARWKGSNVLGWALVQVREEMRLEDEQASEVRQ